MSSDQTKNNKERRRGIFSDEQKRMTSITRKMHRYLIGRKIARNLGTDILTAVLLTVGWCAEQEYAAFGSLAFARSRSFRILETAAEPGADIIYRVSGTAGRPLLSVSCLLPFLTRQAEERFINPHHPRLMSLVRHNQSVRCQT